MAIDEEAIRAAIRNEIRRKVRGQVRAKLGFIWHASVFAIVNVALYAINQAYSPNTQWFVWPFAGWGMALAFHGLGIMTSRHSEYMIEQEVQREFARRGLA